ncbi:MAG: glycine zipper family protein [Cupriavidus sp.]|nr:glycine zipper family protein [Cupriavidus sp.]
MKPRSVSLLMAAALALVIGACTTMPSGPSVMVLPGSKKTFDQFLSDDHTCRQFALGRVGGVSAHQTSTTAPVTSSASGGGYTSDSADSAQYQYDAAYIQCMYASGHRVPAYGQMLAAPPATPPADYKPYSPPPGPQGYAP